MRSLGKLATWPWMLAGAADDDLSTFRGGQHGCGGADVVLQVEPEASGSLDVRTPFVCWQTWGWTDASVAANLMFTGVVCDVPAGCARRSS